MLVTFIQYEGHLFRSFTLELLEFSVRRSVAHGAILRSIIEDM
jgi:hypothetical protein